MYINELSTDPLPNQIQGNKVQKIGFYECLRWTLMAGRLSGLLPISGLRQHDSRLTKFSWCTPYSLLCLIFTGFQVGKIALHTAATFGENLSLTRFSNYILNLITFFLMMMHLNFSKVWSNLLKDVQLLEDSLPPLEKQRVARINRILILIMIPCCVQVMVHISVTVAMTHLCFVLPEDSGLYIKSYAYASYNWMYNIIPFDYFSAIMFQVAKIQNSYMWNYNDTLIVIISAYLIGRFEDFNKEFEEKVNSVSLSESGEHSWNEFRERYTFLMKLVGTIDEYINGMILLSYSNIIIIGKQIYTILNRRIKQIIVKSECSENNLDLLTMFYYVYSASVLLTRTMLVSNFGARLHLQSRKPLNSLNIVPAKAYDNCFQRFMDQVYHSNISLSGLKCFFITREMILTLLASLLTYELVLLQSKH